MAQTVTAYQRLIASHFGTLGYATSREWRSRFDLVNCYSPRLDLAVGPFAIDGQFGHEYDRLEDRNQAFLATIFDLYRGNVHRSGTPGIELPDHHHSMNHNARCFLAIEIENKVSRKHLLGGVVNAAALGRYGIVVGWDQGKLRALIRTQAYLAFLALAGKPTFSTRNLIILTPTQLLSALAGLASVT